MKNHLFIDRFNTKSVRKLIETPVENILNDSQTLKQIATEESMDLNPMSRDAGMMFQHRINLNPLFESIPPLQHVPASIQPTSHSTAYNRDTSIDMQNNDRASA